MRVAVDGPAYGASALTFERANHDAAVLHHNLASALASCGGMAGSESAFASAYDPAARLTLDAVGDLVAALATCGRLCSASLAHHEAAEERSVVPGAIFYTDCAMPAHGYVTVLPASVPFALGHPASSLPSWAAWVLDQVEGFVWPDASTDDLHAAAAAWDAAADGCHALASYCSSAAASLALSRSAETPVALAVVVALRRTCDHLGDQCATLRAACASYAEQVAAHRAAVLDLVHDLIRDAIFIQGIGFVLGTVTAGTTAEAAALVNTARIAALAPRLLRVLAALRAAAETITAPLRLAADAARGVRDELAVFRRFRETVAGAEDFEQGLRVARLRELVRHPALTKAREFEGLSRQQVARALDGWKTRASSRGSGVVYERPGHYGHQFRVMDGYPPGSRPDPITWGPYLEIAQNGKTIKIPLEGNPTL